MKDNPYAFLDDDPEEPELDNDYLWLCLVLCSASISLLGIWKLIEILYTIYTILPPCL